MERAISRVSVLTPVYRPVPTFLVELHASLDAQLGVEWEWLLQVDGGRSLLRRIPAAIRADARVALDVNGRWFGQSITRNLALERARYPLLQTVDADDVLLPGALATAAAALDDEPTLALAFGRTLTLGAAGGRRLAKNPYAPGRLEPGLLVRDWERRGGSCSIVVASAMWRTALLDAHRGWPATVAGSDVMLLLAIAGDHPARHLDRDTYLYRSHPQQIHRSAQRSAMRPHYRAMARRMLAARDELGLATPPARDVPERSARRR